MTLSLASRLRSLGFTTVAVTDIRNALAECGISEKQLNAAANDEQLTAFARRTLDWYRDQERSGSNIRNRGRHFDRRDPGNRGVAWVTGGSPGLGK